MTGERREGPARREFSDGGGLVRLIIGSHVILEKDVDYPFPHIEDTVSRINRALSPLVARADMASRLAEAVRDVKVSMARHHDKTQNHYIGLDDKEHPCAECGAIERLEEALKSWDAIKGDGE